MTIRQEKFQARKAQYDDQAEIIGLACGGLMEFVERGELRGEALDAYLFDKLGPYLKVPVDAIVLGCTHYPFLTGAIRRIVGRGPEILDGSHGVAMQQGRRLAAAGKLSAREAAAVDAAGLCRFALSPLGRRIAAAPRVLREIPFALLCPAERFFPGAEGEELLLQGVVDCCLIEPDGAVIVDYKTDRIAPEAAPERAKRYAAQLETYAWAVSRITGLAVKAKIVYFLQPGEAVEL